MFIQFAYTIRYNTYNMFVINQLFRTKNWVEVNDDARGTYNTNNQIKFKTSMLKPILCDYSDVYILANETITVAALAAGGCNNNMQLV